MPVLSRKQFDLKAKEKKIAAAGSDSKKSGPAATTRKDIKGPVSVYTFLFPEAIEGRSTNFTNKIMLGGAEREIKCVNNKVETSDPVVVDYLRRNQYLFFMKKEI